MTACLFGHSSRAVDGVRAVVACLLLCLHAGYAYAEEKPATATSSALTGTVKAFYDTKGYGFIVPDDGSDEVYVHYSRIQMEGFRTLKKGDRVRFGVTTGRRTFREAADVELIPDEKPPTPR